MTFGENRPENNFLQDNVTVLIADDEADFREIFSDIIAKMGYSVVTAKDGFSALEVVDTQPIDIALIDFKMPGMTGLELLREIKQKSAGTEVIVITGMGTIDSAVEAMKSGAYDYITKPVNFEELETILRRIVHTQLLLKENERLREALRQKYKFQNLIGATPEMLSVFQRIEKASKNHSTVLVQGESGTGKGLIARAIHFNGPWAQKPFLPVDCSAINSNLVESELFGHEKGSFTGAVYSKKGLFRLAEGGTVFLEEIAELPRAVQAKLVKVLDEHVVKPVGSAQSVPIHVRVIAASSENLEKAVQEGKFREDLYERLQEVQIHVPPLRERKDDIPLLVVHFIEEYRRKHPKSRIRRVASEVLKIFRVYTWPGNVRELENIIERAFALETGEIIQTSNLPEYVRHQTGAVIRDLGAVPLRSLEEIEREAIERTLRATHGDKNQAAQILGIDRSTLYRKMKRYGL